MRCARTCTRFTPTRGSPTISPTRIASLAKLDEWERELDLAYAGTPRHPVFIALADTIRRFDIPRQPFADLLTAFRSDVNFKGFDTIDDLLGYSRYSANPVGRIVLYLFGYRDAERQRLSDLRVQRTCSSRTSGRMSRSISARAGSISRGATWSASA